MNGFLWRQRVPFSAEIPSVLPAAILWRELEQAFESSERSSLWPNHLSRVLLMQPPGAPPRGLEVGRQVRVTYNLGVGHSSYRYRVEELERGRALSYVAPPEHPLKGGARVRVEPRDGGSTLYWDGEYRSRGPGSLVAVAFFRLHFERAFFRALTHNLRRLERRLGYPRLTPEPPPSGSGQH